MQEVLSILPCADIRALTMDREFVGGLWLSRLRLMEIPFVVRVKANTMVGGSPPRGLVVRAQPLEEQPLEDNINRKKLEALLHRFFGSARLDLELKDRFGSQVEPKEWFLVPLDAI